MINHNQDINKIEEICVGDGIHKSSWKAIMEEATRKVEWRIAVETVLRVLNAYVVYRVEMIESFQL
jgi:hypothetical protein